MLILLVLLGGGGFVIWGSQGAGPSQEALAAMESGGGVNVALNGDWLVLSPQESIPTTGFIFYPGGRVDYRSYAPLLREIAAGGVLVVDVRMPLNLAVFGVDRANEVMQAFPEIRHWAIGGHSLGGAMAANYVFQSLGAVDGLVLWASYPADGNSLSTQSDLAVVSIFGSRDGLATGEKIEHSRGLLPESTRFVQVEGGNHAGFGSYGAQDGDLAAQISTQEQWQQVVSASLELLNSLK